MTDNDAPPAQSVAVCEVCRYPNNLHENGKPCAPPAQSDHDYDSEGFCRTHPSCNSVGPTTHGSEEEDGRFAKIGPVCSSAGSLPDNRPAEPVADSLKERLRHWAHNYQINNPLQSTAIFNEALARIEELEGLLPLALEKYVELEDENKRLRELISAALDYDPRGQVLGEEWNSAALKEIME